MDSFLRREQSRCQNNQELRNYLSDLYLNRNGKALLVVTSAGFKSTSVFSDLRYEMGRQDKRFLYAVYLYIHPNLDFVIDEATKEEYRQELVPP